MFAEKKILICEDDKNLANNMRNYFSLKKAEVQVALSGKEGAMLISSFSPDVVITDVNMPEIDGYSFLKELRNLNTTIPIIVVTGEHKLQKLFEMEKIEAFIRKPFSMSDLEEAVLRALGK